MQEKSSRFRDAAMQGSLPSGASGSIFEAMDDLSIDIDRAWNGDDVLRLCERHGFSQRKLASLLGLRPSTVNDWVTGKSTVSQLASLLLSYVELDLNKEMVVKRKKNV